MIKANINKLKASVQITRENSKRIQKLKAENDILEKNSISSLYNIVHIDLMNAWDKIKTDDKLIKIYFDYGALTALVLIVIEKNDHYIRCIERRGKNAIHRIDKNLAKEDFEVAVVIARQDVF